MFKDLLIKYDITAYKLSKDAKIPYTTISELVTNKRTIDLCYTKTLYKISEFLKIPMEDVYKISITKTPKIPNCFKNIFWDTDFDKLDFYKNKFYIITRLINKGGIKGFLFVFDSYDDYDIKEAAIKSRLWDRISANYISIKYSINKDEMEYYKWNKTDWR